MGKNMIEKRQEKKTNIWLTKFVFMIYIAQARYYDIYFKLKLEETLKRDKINNEKNLSINLYRLKSLETLYVLAFKNLIIEIKLLIKNTTKSKYKKSVT